MVTQSSNGTMNMTIIEFLDANDISVTKFLEHMNYYTDLDLQNNLKVLEFLDRPITEYLQ